MLPPIVTDYEKKDPKEESRNDRENEFTEGRPELF